VRPSQGIVYPSSLSSCHRLTMIVFEIYRWSGNSVPFSLIFPPSSAYSSTVRPLELDQESAGRRLWLPEPSLPAIFWVKPRGVRRCYHIRELVRISGSNSTVIRLSGLKSAMQPPCMALLVRRQARAYQLHRILDPRLDLCTGTALEVEGRALAPRGIRLAGDMKFRSCATLFAAATGKRDNAREPTKPARGLRAYRHTG
jgi:hypothetical protein